MVDEYRKGLKRMNDRAGENAAKIRDDAKKIVLTVKKARQDLSKDAGDLTKEANFMADGVAQEIAKDGKEIYEDIAKRVKKSRGKA